MRLQDFIAASVKKLKEVGIDSADLDTRLLVCHALKLDRAQLLAQNSRDLTGQETSQLQTLIDRRAKHEPVGRILGNREFWSLSFGLNEATLEPRPDSETLIEAVLENIPKKDASLHILDLGTGTGCLLLSLLHELGSSTGLGIDIAPRAVEQASINAKNLDLQKRATFQTGNWLESIDDKFDIIISNPPYIPHADIKGLMPEVRNYDPVKALDGGDGGLAVYKQLIPQLPTFLKNKGFVAFEVGQHQAEEVVGLFHQNGFTKITTHEDLGGIERCVVAHMP